MSDYNVKVFDPVSCSYTYVSWYYVTKDKIEARIKETEEDGWVVVYYEMLED